MPTRNDVFSGTNSATSAPEAILPAPEAVPSDCRGLNFWDIDRSIRELLPLYLGSDELAHFRQHFDRLGGLAGGSLDELASTADKNPPVLVPRDKFGRDTYEVDYHPSYREMERIAFSEFGLAAIGHKEGVLGWPRRASPLVKYTLTYLFAQAEFGLLCPVNGNDSAVRMIEGYADDGLRERMAGMLSQDMQSLAKIGHFMTERSGGSDLGAIETRAERDGEHWKLYGEKWFCSAIDADFILALARPTGAVPGTRGLGMFVVPRCLPDGTRNALRICRLKSKLGTRSMATGEVVFEGATAYAVGQVSNGIKMAVIPINHSRLSHGVRAAGMMRRCLNEALRFARHRTAFQKRVIDHPLMKRSLMKILVPAEQALSAFLFVARTLAESEAGSEDARKIVRIATALLKFRACRDNATVATAAMEVWGGCGYIEEWVTARLVRDAQTGLLWEGTSNINALDIVKRVIAKERAHEALQARLLGLLAEVEVPQDFREALQGALARCVDRAVEISARPELEHLAREAASALYHAMCAVLLAYEGSRIRRDSGDARRLLLSWMVLTHRVEGGKQSDIGTSLREQRAAEVLLDESRVVTMEEVCALIGGERNEVAGAGSSLPSR